MVPAPWKPPGPTEAGHPIDIAENRLADYRYFIVRCFQRSPSRSKWNDDADGREGHALGVAAGLMVVGTGCILRSWLSSKRRAHLNRPSGALSTQEILAVTTRHPGRFWTMLTVLAVVVSFAVVFIPDSTAWDNGERRYVCAAPNAPGQHLIHTVRDSHL